MKSYVNEKIKVSKPIPEMLEELMQECEKLDDGEKPNIKYEDMYQEVYVMAKCLALSGNISDLQREQIEMRFGAW